MGLHATTITLNGTLINAGDTYVQPFCVDQDLVFEASDLGDCVERIEWNFGDGTTATSTTATGWKVTHSYTVTNWYPLEARFYCADPTQYEEIYSFTFRVIRPEWTHAPHGYALAAVSMAYYRRAMLPGLAKFVRFAKNVWNIDGSGMTDEQIAEAGLEALKNWMLEIGLPLTISEIGATPDMIPGITEGTICYPAGYLDLKPEDITEILKESM